MMQNEHLPSLSELTNSSLPLSADEKIPSIPDRMYFRIGDVAEIAGVQPYVLRFWEKEFDFLAPIKNASGQRLYRKGDVESVLLIKRLLYLERYSIEGAKKRIKELRKEGGLKNAKRERSALDDHKIECIRTVKEELRSLIDLVS
ncbi:MAG: MerR family transcriptional regulator [Bacteriovoracia bacterium]